MVDVFLKIINMSISASWIVLVLLLLRLLFQKAPKWITVLLWGVVAIRLVCPFSIESVMSLIPSAETIRPEIMMENTPAIHSGVPIINNIVNPIIGESFAPDPSASANPLQILIPVLSIVWIAGIAIMLAYTVISCFRVKSKIGTAVLLRENIFQSESVVSPFVLGIIKPKIYLPFNMNEQDLEHVIAHETAHIRRKDHWWKPVGFLILTLHWFNPFIWLGYILLCRDIELACDEKVIKKLNTEQKADYSQALLTCSVNRRAIAVCPLAFGEIGVKQRIRSVLNYKKPGFWITILTGFLCLSLAVCFLTDPRSSKPDSTADETETESSTTEQFAPKTEVYLSATGEYPWILPPTSISFPEGSKCRHRISIANQNIETFFMDEKANTPYQYYHRITAVCIDCGEEVEAESLYCCQWNNPQCKGGCLSGVPNSEAGIQEEVIEMEYATKEILDHPDRYFYFSDETGLNTEWNLVFKTKLTVQNFKFFAIDESETMKIEQVLYTIEELTPEKPFVVSTYINDATVNRGISFVDSDGNTQYYVINFSGRDGSLWLSKANLL